MANTIDLGRLTVFELQDLARHLAGRVADLEAARADDAATVAAAEALHVRLGLAIPGWRRAALRAPSGRFAKG